MALVVRPGLGPQLRQQCRWGLSPLSRCLPGPATEASGAIASPLPAAARARAARRPRRERRHGSGPPARTSGVRTPPARPRRPATPRPAIRRRCSRPQARPPPARLRRTPPHRHARSVGTAGGGRSSRTASTELFTWNHAPMVPPSRDGTTTAERRRAGRRRRTFAGGREPGWVERFE